MQNDHSNKSGKEVIALKGEMQGPRIKENRETELIANAIRLIGGWTNE